MYFSGLTTAAVLLFYKVVIFLVISSVPLLMPVLPHCLSPMEAGKNKNKSVLYPLKQPSPSKMTPQLYMQSCSLISR